MATIRRIFTYDVEEHKVIHDFLESIPERHRSKYIRLAIRMYIKKTNEEVNTSRTIYTNLH